MPEYLHSEKSTKAAETGCKQQKGLLGDPPFAFLGLGFVDPVKHEGDKAHNCVKNKKNSHAYIIIVEMRISNRAIKVFSRCAAAVLCLAVLSVHPGCSILDDTEYTDEQGSVSSSVTDYSSSVSDVGTSESYYTENDTGYERVSRAYVYSAWYDVEKDNPVDYTSIDSNDAYALKCVFYFNEPVTGTFRVVLKKDGRQLAVKDIRISDKVVCECDFSAGLEGIGTFEAGVYTVSLETEGNSIAVSGEMRVN